MSDNLLLIEGHNSSHHDGGVAVYDCGRVVAVTAERIDRVKHSGNSRAAYDAILPRLSRHGKDVHDHFDPSYKPDQQISHPLAHAAGAFYPSGFDDALVLVVDGQGYHQAGEVVSTSVWRGTGHNLAPLELVSQPGPFCDNSLGHFYSAVTYYLGFGFYEQGKTMALAALGGDSAMRRRLAPYCTPYMTLLDTDPAFIRNVFYAAFGADFNWPEPPDHHKLMRRYAAQFGPRRAPRDPLTLRHFNLAWAAQDILEEVLLTKCRQLWETHRLPYLCLAGGVALNVSANTRIRRETPYTDVFIQPAASDDGQALGKLLYRLHAQFGSPRRRMTDAFLGLEYSKEDGESALSTIPKTCRVQRFSDPADLLPTVARLLADGRVVAWYEGRAELGPRALGHRSILADPRLPGVRHVLNAGVKHREFFQPFGLAIIEGRARDLLDIPGASPFMLLTGRATERARHETPAAIHEDGSCRVQTVAPDVNGRFYDLIAAFESLTGVPALINTSFNDRGEPLVETPQDAVAAFNKMAIDALVMERALVEK